jgi:restriction endonuclease
MSLKPIPSTLDRGNQFRDRVCSLLRSAGFTVATETRIKHKKVDALAEKREFGRVKRFAIECKAYSRKISKPQSIRIIADYRGLKDQHLIDEVWVITEVISPDARLHIDSIEGFRAFQFTELAHIFADFQPYLTHLQSIYTTDDVGSFYIPIRTSTGADLEDYILHHWIDHKDNTPIAIEAGYGKGKTTFCYHMGNLLAARATLSSSSRIPIYVPLGEIATE